MKTELLLKLASYLDAGQLIHKIFDFSVVNNCNYRYDGCGTAGCAMGELPGCFPEDWFFFKDNTDNTTLNMRSYLPALKKYGISEDPYYSYPPYDLDEHVAEFFDIDIDMVEHLFYPRRQNRKFVSRDDFRMLLSSASPNEVARNIRKTIENMITTTLYDGFPYNQYR